MTINDVKKQIQSNKLDNYYIFSGEEIAIQNIYIRKIAETANMKVVHADSLSDIWESLTSPSLFNDPQVYVLRDDKDLMQVTDINIQGGILVHCLTVVDKRTKYYKTYSDRIVVFEHLNAGVLLKYVQRDSALNKSNSERLIAICENDYSRLLLEIDKILCYAKIFEVSPDEAMADMLDSGAIYIPPRDAIFDFVDAVMRRDAPLAYSLLQECYAVGEANMVLVNVLYSNTKQMLQVQSFDGDDIVASTGLTAWQIKCARSKMGKYSIGELVFMLGLLQQIQKDIVTGKIDDSMSVEYFLTEVL